MSNYEDVCTELSNLEYAIDALESTELGDLVEAVRECSELHGKVERELSYLEDDANELEEYREFGDLETIAGMSDELADLKADGAAELKATNEKNVRIINALLARFAGLRHTISEEEIRQLVGSVK